MIISTPVRRRCRSGLSLIEVMINMAIVSLLFAAVTSALLSMVQSFRGNEAFLHSRQTATVAMDYMLTYIRQAKQINFPTPPSGLTEVTPLPSQITLLDPLDAVHTTRTFFYDAASQSLCLSFTTGTTQSHVVLSKVTNLAFHCIPERDAVTTNPTLRTITIEMTLASNDSNGKPITLTFSGTAYARSIPLA